VKKIPLFVVGAKGLLAAETMRLALSHPHLHPIHAFSRTELTDLRDVHPQLSAPIAVRSLHELPTALSTALQYGPTALVFATPHGVAGSMWTNLQKQLLQGGVDAKSLYLVDLSEDHRLEKNGPWHYGLPELHEISASTRQVAVAGCFATAMQLAVMPLQRAELLDSNAPFILNGVTASSGSGAVAKQGTHHPFRQSNFHPYALNGHRHEKELCHSRNFATQPQVVFLPFSGPLGRGIYLTAHLTLQNRTTPDDLHQAFQSTYADQPFIELIADQAPQLRSVIGSNRAAIGWNQRSGMVQVFVALDNTIKGGAGQGLQCLNLMLNLPQTTALPLAGLGY